MKLPREVARYLKAYKYDPTESTEFGTNFLARKISSARAVLSDGSPSVRTLATLCAVPRGPYKERTDSLVELGQWLDAPRIYTPAARLVSKDVELFSADGVIRAEFGNWIEEGDRGWQSYVYVARDGYVEAGQSAGFVLKGRTYFQFAPLVAWIERCWSLLSECGNILDDPPRYHVVLHLADCVSAELTTFGHVWQDPTDDEYRWRNDRVPTCLEQVVQISRVHEAGADVEEVGKWFAERIANAFGFGEARCFNHESAQGRQGPPGVLPADRLEFR